MAEVFLSYAGPDRATASRLAADLARSEINVWYDLRQLQAGDNWREIISRKGSKTPP